MVTITFNGVDKSTFVLRRGSWSLNKRLVAETFSCTILDPSGTFEPAENDVVVVYQDTDLMFGGTVKTWERERFAGEGPVSFNISCRGKEEKAEKSIVTGSTAANPILTEMYALYTKYLAPKGVTWLGPTTGGSSISAMTFTRTRLGDIFSRACKEVNMQWRINGEDELAFVTAGDLPLPVNPLTSSDLLLGSVKVSKKAYDYANRLILQTGGTGETTHTETHTADGTKTYFLLSVEPKPAEQAEDLSWTFFHPTQVTVNGVTHNLDGSTGWSYDAVDHAVYTSGAAPTSGHLVVVSFTIGFPSTVRSWSASALNADGSLNYAVLEDKLVNLGHITNVNEAKVWGDIELTRITLTPRIVTASSYRKGFYPLQSGPLYIPEDNVNDDFLLQNVSISDDELDPRLPEIFRFNLELIEGGVAGRQWENLWREFSGQGSGGGTVTYGTGGTVETPGSGGGTGTVGYPIGHVIHLAGDNYNAVPLTTTWGGAPQAIPQKLGGADFAGTWRLRVPMYLLSAGTMEARLYDQSTGATLATVSTTTVAALLSNGYDYTEVTFSAPATLDNILLEVRVSSGTNNGVVGHSTLVKES